MKRASSTVKLNSGLHCAASNLCLQSWLMQLQGDLQGNEGRSQCNCCVKVEVWGVGIARHPVFSRIKWLLASMWGAFSVGRVRSSLVCAQTSPTVQSRLMPLHFDLQGNDSRLQWNCFVKVMLGR